MYWGENYSNYFVYTKAGLLFRKTLFHFSETYNYVRFLSSILDKNPKYGNNYDTLFRIYEKRN